jgi:hypothetical protein
MEPNVVECVCPRCTRTHYSFVEAIAGPELWNVCENCLTPEEKIAQKELWRINLDKKYENLLKTTIVEVEQAYLGLPK